MVEMKYELHKRLYEKENVDIEFFLPFIIIFAVVYGMLHKTRIFGDPAKDPTATKINAIIAFAFGLFIMVYPTRNKMTKITIE